MPRPITFAFPPLTPHSHDHIPSFPLDVLVRLAREDLLEALGGATRDVHGEGMLGLDDLLAVALRAHLDDTLSFAGTVGTSERCCQQ
jgi:hypothetical protein